MRGRTRKKNRLTTTCPTFTGQTFIRDRILCFQPFRFGPVGNATRARNVSANDFGGGDVTRERSEPTDLYRLVSAIRTPRHLRAHQVFIDSNSVWTFFSPSCNTIRASAVISSARSTTLCIVLFFNLFFRSVVRALRRFFSFRRRSEEKYVSSPFEFFELFYTPRHFRRWFIGVSVFPGHDDARFDLARRSTDRCTIFKIARNQLQFVSSITWNNVYNFRFEDLNILYENNNNAWACELLNIDNSWACCFPLFSNLVKLRAIVKL